MREWSVTKNLNHASDLSTAIPLSVVMDDGITSFTDANTGAAWENNLFYNFLQQTNQLAWILDNEGILLFASKAFYKYFEIEEQECMNRNVMETIPITVTHSLYELHNRVLTSGNGVESTQRIRLADGNNLICFMNIFSLGSYNGKKLVGGHAIRLPDTSELEKKYHQAQERLLTLNRATSDAIWEWDMQNGLPIKMIGSLNDVSNLKALEDKLAKEKVKRQKEISEIMVKAQEKERTRIGHELHDNVNQLLSATKLFVDYLTPIGKEQRKVKQKSIDYIQLAIDEIRKLSKELVAPSLKEKGLIQSIRGLAEDIEMVGVMRVRFEHDDKSEHLSNGKKVALFRIAQEQLKNILKHSHAKNTSISLYTCDEQVKLIITDDGDGFNPQQTYRGIGLENIRERVNFYNGAVDIHSSRGQGCILTVILPTAEE